MPDSNLTEIVVVLDRSGSMADLRVDMEKGYNQFILAQRNGPGECRVTLVQFDSQAVETVYESKPVAVVPPMVLEPRGATPLLDALGETIDRTGARYTALADEKRPSRVIVLVITDGQENASRRFTLAQVREKITHQTDAYGWAFSYLGTNVDAFAEASSLGISVSTSSGYSGDHVQTMFATVSTASLTSRATPGSAAGSYTLSDEDRQKMGGTAPKSA